MNIAQFNARGPHNGVEHWFDLIHDELEQRGHNVIQYWVRGRKPTWNEIQDIDFCFYHFSQVAFLYMRSIRKPFCVLPSANDIFPNNGETLMKVSKSRNCKFITYQSLYHIKKYKEWEIEGQFQYVPMPVRVDTFKRNRKYNKDFKYLAGGRLIPKKGLHQLKGIDNLRIFGDGPLRDELQRMMPNVEFLGELNTTKLKNAYERSSLYLFPAVITNDGDSDGIANTVKEAMLMELPVITSSVAGMKELENVIHLDDWSKIGEILDDDKVFQNNLKGKEEILKTYSPNICVDMLLKGIDEYI